MRHVISLLAVVGAVAAILAFGGCESAADGEGCPVGSEGCPCTGGGTCDGRLTCASGLCVDTRSNDEAGRGGGDSTGQSGEGGSDGADGYSGSGGSDGADGDSGGGGSDGADGDSDGADGDSGDGADQDGSAGSVGDGGTDDTGNSEAPDSSDGPTIPSGPKPLYWTCTGDSACQSHLTCSQQGYCTKECNAYWPVDTLGGYTSFDCLEDGEQVFGCEAYQSRGGYEGCCVIETGPELTAGGMNYKYDGHCRPPADFTEKVEDLPDTSGDGGSGGGGGGEDGCDYDSQCGYHEACKSGQCVRVECTNSTHCGSCERCSNNVCRDCGSGPYGCYC